MAALTDRDSSQQFVIPFGGNFVLFTAFQIVTDPDDQNTALAIGSLSDALGQCTPVALPIATVLLSGVIGLMPRHVATSLRMSVAANRP